MAMPDELTIELNQFDLAVADLRRDMRLPRCVDPPERLGDVYFAHGLISKTISAPGKARTLPHSCR